MSEPVVGAARLVVTQLDLETDEDGIEIEINNENEFQKRLTFELVGLLYDSEDAYLIDENDKVAALELIAKAVAGAAEQVKHVGRGRKVAHEFLNKLISKNADGHNIKAIILDYWEAVSAKHDYDYTKDEGPSGLFYVTSRLREAGRLTDDEITEISEEFFRRWPHGNGM